MAQSKARNDAPEATYTSRGSADFVGKDRMQDAIGHALVREELVKRGATSEEIQALLKDVDLKTHAGEERQSRGGRREQEFLGRVCDGLYAVFRGGVLRRECGPFGGSGKDFAGI